MNCGCSDKKPNTPCDCHQSPIKQIVKEIEIHADMKVILIWEDGMKWDAGNIIKIITTKGFEINLNENNQSINLIHRDSE